MTSAGFVLRPATLPELSTALNGLSSSKAVGLDEIPIVAVRKCFDVIGPILLHIINFSIVTCSFPTSWKDACVVPLFKSGSHDTPSNFGPISLLSVLSKLCEKTVCGQLTSYLSENHILAESQFAYRKGHSTEDALLVTIDWIARQVENGRVASMVSLDLSKAFDSVDHPVLLRKLQWYGIDPRWFRSYLSDRRQVVRGGTLFLPLTHGVPQGSLLGPILFSIFTNDLPSYLSHGSIISYADDTQLLDSEAPENFRLLKIRQEATLCLVQAYLTSNSLKMNPSKTTLLLVGTPQSLKKVTSFSLEVSGHTLTQSTSVKMLGVVIDSKLSWESHISILVKKCNSILLSLYKIRHHLTPEARQLLIQAHVFPHILYCISVWGGAAACHLGRVQRLVNFAARIVSGARRSDHISPILADLGWRRVDDLVTQRDCLGVQRALTDRCAPEVIRALFVPRASVSDRMTRASVSGALELPDFRLAFARRTFAFRAARSWNRLLPVTSEARTRGQQLPLLP